MNSTILLIFLNWSISGVELADKMWTDKGLANDLWFMQVFAIIDPFTTLINLALLKKLLARWRIKADADGVESLTMTQREANEAFEGPDFIHHSRISKYLKSIMLAMFLLCIFPVSSLISMFCISIYYWFDKIYLLRFTRIPDYSSVQLIYSVLNYFEFILVVAAVIVDLTSGESSNIRQNPAARSHCALDCVGDIRYHDSHFLLTDRVHPEAAVPLLRRNGKCTQEHSFL